MLLVIPAGGGAGYFEATGNGVQLNQIEATALLALSWRKQIYYCSSLGYSLALHMEQTGIFFIVSC